MQTLAAIWFWIALVRWHQEKRMYFKCFAILSLVGMVSGCATVPTVQSPARTPFSGLQNTSWRLVEIQSMDDTQGISRPSDPSRYTLTFNADGRVSAQLDCNRGTGAWSNDIANATGGSLTFGPMAVTRALCPALTLGETIVRQLPYVRSFTMRDGRLNMALMADGGIIVWEPAPTAAQELEQG